MSEAGTGEGTPRLEDVERALVLAREVAAATSGGGGANIRTAHLRALFANGSSAPSPARIQAALEAAGLRADPPLTEDPDSVSLHVEGDRAALARESPVAQRERPPARSTASPRRRPEPKPTRRPGAELDFDEEPPARPRYEPRRAARPNEDDLDREPVQPHDPDFDDDLPVSPRFGAAAYEAAASTDQPVPRRRDDLDPEPVPDDEPDLEFDEPEPEPDDKNEPEPDHDPDAPLRLSDMERLVAERRSHEVNPATLAALMPALIAPVLIAAFVGPLFGAIFAGLCLLAAGLLSRPYALAEGKIGPIRLPHTLTRTYLLIAIVTALVALGLTIALIAAGGSDPSPVDETAPLQENQTTPTTTPPAPPRDNSP